jgi:hypothetical protein
MMKRNILRRAAGPARIVLVLAAFAAAAACENPWIIAIAGTGKEGQAAVPGDTTPPGPVLHLAAAPAAGQVTLTWTDPEDADLHHIEIAWSPGGVPVTVAPGTQTKTVTGLANGTLYTFTVRAADGAGNRSAGETAAAIPVDTLDSVAAVAAYLAAAPGGTAADPVPLPVGITLDAAGWTELLDAIAAADKYVALDLSACARGTGSSGGGLRANGAFNPDGTDTDADRIAAKGKIVSLALPDAAARILAGSFGTSTFEYFTALAEAGGAHVAAIGAYAFDRCAALTTADFPAATTIGQAAFMSCGSLAALSLPAAPPGLGSSVFTNTNLGAGAGTTLTILVPDAAAVSAYVAAWAITADTAAGGNTGNSGLDHKRIVITDTP